MFITKARHEREMRAAKKSLLAEIANTGVDLTNARNEIASLRREKGHAEAERDAANSRCELLEADRDRLSADALKFRQLKSNLIPGGPKAKAKREANGAPAQAVASKWEGPAYEYGTTWGPESADEPA